MKEKRNVVIKESHFHWGWKKKSAVEVNGYDPVHGLDLRFYHHTESENPTPPVTDIVKARKVAGRYQVEKPNNDVVITVLDSESIPENSRNAPLDGNAGFVGVDHRGWGISPKCKRPEPPKGLYEWQPMTDKEKDQLVSESKKEIFVEKKQERVERKFQRKRRR